MGTDSALPRTGRMAAPGLTAVLLAMAMPLVAGQKGPPTHFDVRPESALVHFVRPRFYPGSANTVLLFADDRFLGALDNATYFASYLPPGRHVFWTQHDAAREMYLAAGQAYYLECSLFDITVLDDMAGVALLSQRVRHVTPVPREEQTGARYLKKRGPHGHAPPHEATAPGPAAAPAVPGDDHEGRAWLPRWAPIHLQLLEAISSAHDATGDPVRFEVARDVVVAGAVVIARGTRVDGTLRQAAPALPVRSGAWRRLAATIGLGSGRNVALVEGGRLDEAGTFQEASAAKPGSVGGVLDVAVASVLAHDGTLVPVIGLPAGAESERAFAATGVVLGHGVYGKFALPGLERYDLRGTEVTVATREGTWLAVAAAKAPADPSPDAPGAVRLGAHATARVDLWPPGRRHVPPVIIAIHADAPILSATIAAVGGLPPWRPPSAVRLEPFTGGTTCDFEGWSVARLLDPSPGPGGNRVEIRGVLADGRSFVSEVDLALDVK